jgi:hypothetical protein
LLNASTLLGDNFHLALRFYAEALMLNSSSLLGGVLYISKESFMFVLHKKIYLSTETRLSLRR